MRRLMSPLGGLVVFALIAGLVVGGLGWVTVEALREETARQEANARADAANKERLALWQLDSRLLPTLGVENNRPYAHYFALHIPHQLLLTEAGVPAADPVQAPSPLMSGELPDWMLLHFQIDPDAGWTSPQVVATDLEAKLRSQTDARFSLVNVTPARRDLLVKLGKAFPTDEAILTLSDWGLADEPDSPLDVPFTPADPPASPPATPADAAVRLQPEALGGFAGAGRQAPSRSARGGDAGKDAKPQAEVDRFGQTRGRGEPPPGIGGPPPAPVVPPLSTAAPPAAGAENLRYAVEPQNRPAQTAPPWNALAQNRAGGKQVPEPAIPGRDARKATGERGIQEARGNEQSNYYGKGTQPTQEQADGAKKAVDPGKGKIDEAAGRPPAPATGPPAAAAASPGGRPAGEGAAPGGGIPAPPAPKAAATDGPASPAPKKKSEPAPADPRADADKDRRRMAGLPEQEKGKLVREEAEQLSKALKEAKNGSGEAKAMAAEPPVALALRPPAPTELRKPPPARLQAPAVHLGPMRPQWLSAADGTEYLLLVRAARLETKTVYQGIVLDWPRLRDVLREEVKPLFPDARLEPVRDPADVSERAMTALPAQLDPGAPPAAAPPGWTPLRLGLTIAWIAAVVALAAVGFGGRALIDLSERRIRFVSAVTHELRTPLTSLRLYLDLLTSGMIRDEDKQREYLTTLHGESERLHRLIENVLDFARLEKRSVKAHRQPMKLADLFDQVRQTWAERCAADGKDLVVISTLPPDQEVCTDARMAAQVLGNLIDNARKYTRDAADRRIWLWAKPGDRRRIVLEVEDRGPGVPAAERCSVFHPFRRGQSADTTAGGAGLGLALAKQWAEVLGGSLDCRAADGGVGACFRLELPVR